MKDTLKLNAFPTSIIQREIYLEKVKNIHSTIYNIGFLLKISKSLCQETWEKALVCSSAKHDILSCSVDISMGEIVHLLSDNKEISFECFDFKKYSYADVHEYVHQLTEKPIDYSDAPLIKHFLFQLSEHDWIAALIAPHIIFDGYSAKIFFEDVCLLYQSIAEGKDITPINVPPFFNFVTSLQDRFDTEETHRFWTEALVNCTQNNFNPQIGPKKYTTKKLILSKEEGKTIKLYCSKNKIHLPAFFLGIYALVLRMYGNSKGDLLIYSIIGLRPKEFLKTVGCFFHVLPFLIKENFLDVRQVSVGLFQYIEAYAHKIRNKQYTSSSFLSKIAGEENVKLFYNFQRYTLLSIFDQKQVLDVLWSHPENEVHLLVNDLGTNIELELHFHERYLTDHNFLARLQNVAKQIVGADSVGKKIDFFLPTEKKLSRVLEKIHSSRLEFRTLLEAFEDHARLKPTADALRFRGQTMSYETLLIYSRKYADTLLSHGVRARTMVGICLEPSPELVITVLAVLMTGAAYVPINTRYPAHRIETMMEDVEPSLIITQSKFNSAFSRKFPLLNLDSYLDLTRSKTPIKKTNTSIQSEDPAYVIYTSGTTGRPKGVVVTHGNIARLFSASADFFHFNGNDKWTLFHSIAFDFSVWEFWGALAHGGTLIIVPDEIARLPEKFYALACEEKITVLNQTPSAFYALQHIDQSQGGRLDSLRYLIFGGEPLGIHKLMPWFELHGDSSPMVFNMYGITETTVHVTCRRLRADDLTKPDSNRIGRPLKDLAVQIAGNMLNPLPPGFAGEICIGGAGVARGYLKRKELNRERFPVTSSLFSGKRFYRSGDLGRFLPDGEIEFLGRIDNQVKIRGFRIEPGEIEAVLMRHPDIKEALILVHENMGKTGKKDSEQQLTAYLTLYSSQEPDPDSVKSLLEKYLPDYMIPVAYIFLDQFPLTANGKVDRSALPLPTRENILNQTYESPRTNAEKLITKLFSEVLHVPRVGIHDNFFQLGGHSLAVVQLAARYQQSTGTEFPLCAVFEHPTAAELAASLNNFCCDISSPLTIGTVPSFSKETIPLSSSQERVWYLIQMTPENRSYEFLSVFQIYGPLKVEILKNSLQKMVDRHEIYRTTFHEREGLPYQSVHEQMEVILDCTSFSDDKIHIDEEKYLEEAIATISGSPFKLDSLPLVRWKIIQVAKNKYFFIHFEHHLLHDGWSFVVFIKELCALYTSLVNKQPSPLPPLDIHFSEYVVRQRKWIKTIENVQLQYWKKVLEGADFDISLPLDFPRPAERNFSGNAIRYDLEPVLLTKLKKLGRSYNTTLFMIMIAAFAAMLAKYCRKKDLVIGTSFANRRWKETELLLGMLINNLPLRFDVSQTKQVSDFIAEVRENVLGASEHQDIPFNKIVEAINPPRSSGINPLFQTLFTAYEGPMPYFRMPQLKVQLMEGINTGFSKFDLNVIAISRPKNDDGLNGSRVRDQLLLIWEYSTSLFSERTMRSMLSHYIKTLQFFTENPSASIQEMNWTVPDEVDYLLEWGVNRPNYPRDRSVHSIFEEMVDRHSQSTAIKYKQKKISYTELNTAADKVAAYIIREKIIPGSHIAVAGIRCPEMVIAFLGVLKAGGVYVPLDSRSPKKRQQMIVSEIKARLILTVGVTGPIEQLSEASQMSVESILHSKYDSAEIIAPPPMYGKDPAYIMYTSGSTGRPKGAIIPHRGITRLVLNTDYVKLNNRSIVLQLAAPSFDASTFELWAPLLNGGTCVIYPGEVPDTGELKRTIQSSQVNTLWLTSSLFNLIIDENPEILKNVGQILVGGEPLSVKHIKKACNLLPKTQLINGYGPTENTTFSCCYNIPPKISTNSRSIPIGRPISGSEVYIVDKAHNLVPVGIPGEIFIGGDGLSLGYLNRPALTDEKFITAEIKCTSHGLGRSICKKVYKTGDLARWLPDGNLEFLGRLDEQIKIRGFLVEPTEVRAALNRHPQVLDAAVIMRENKKNSKELIAYIQFANSSGPICSNKELRDFLAGWLPDYMIPTILVRVNNLPLTINGKLNINALPAPQVPQHHSDMSDHAKNSLQSDLAAIWMDVLQLSQPPGMHDNFFDLGGSSLTLIQVHSKIELRLNKTCSVLDLLNYPTISSIAESLSNHDTDRFSKEKIQQRAKKRKDARSRGKKNIR